MTDTGGVISCLMGCDIINTVVWYDRVDTMSSAVERISHMPSVVSSTQSVVMSYLVDIMS